MDITTNCNLCNLFFLRSTAVLFVLGGVNENNIESDESLLICSAKSLKLKDCKESKRNTC